MTRCALIMAGGTGGHIFPALALARALRARGWRVHWLGGVGEPGQPSMESRLVPPEGFAFEPIAFGGLRGKGWSAALTLPWRLLRACWQSLRVLQRVRPCVVIGLGGYITVPGGLMAALTRRPLLLHEQNAVAGMANRWLARVARRVYTGFPEVLAQGIWVGNPLRAPFLQAAPPQQRFAGRSGPLRVLVVGGSLGAQALNELVPKALALLAPSDRPEVLHQSGMAQIDALRGHYAAARVQAELVPFIEDTASAFAQADLVICRAGASTVSEIAAIGAAALFVPFPFAVDDHQTRNARFLSDQGAAWLQPQHQITPRWLADMLQKTERSTLSARALAAKNLEKTGAVEVLVAACEELCA